MRVLHVVSGDLWAGAEVQVFTLLEFLRRQPGLEVEAVLLHDRELARRLREVGVPLTVVDQARLDSWRILWRLVALLRARRPDVVHAHRYKETVLGTAAAAAAGVPAVVSTVHGLVTTEGYRGLAGAKMRLNDWLERRVIDMRHETVVAVSHDMARRLASKVRVPATIIPNGIDVRSHASGRPPVWPAGAPAGPVLGTAARLVPVKGLDRLLEAMRRVAERSPQARLLVLGDGPLRASLEAQAAALGLGRRVWFPGHQADISRWLRAMDVFVLPSLAEGLPMSLLEAMAAGRPVVASRVGGIPEVVRDGVEGRLVPPGDVTALADACLAYLRDPSAREAVGACARARVAEAYTIEATGPRYVDLYRRLVERCRAA